MLSKNGMLVNVPYILEQFILKLDLDAKQERKMDIDEFIHSVVYFRLSNTDWKKMLEDLKSYGVIEEYNVHNKEIVFR